MSEPAQVPDTPRITLDPKESPTPKPDGRRRPQAVKDPPAIPPAASVALSRIAPPRRPAPPAPLEQDMPPLEVRHTGTLANPYELPVMLPPMAAAEKTAYVSGKKRRSYQNNKERVCTLELRGPVLYDLLHFLQRAAMHNREDYSTMRDAVILAEIIARQAARQGF